jgi:hypothetical protein
MAAVSRDHCYNFNYFAEKFGSIIAFFSHNTASLGKKIIKCNVDFQGKFGK